MGSQDSRGAGQLRWATGPEGGSWFAINTVLAEIVRQGDPGLKIEVVARGGRENPSHVEDGSAELGTSIDFLARAAARGDDPYPGTAHGKLRSLGGGWAPLPFHFVAARGAPGSLAEAVLSDGVKIGIPPPETFDELTFRRTMDFLGTSYEGIEVRGGHCLHANYDELPDAFNGGAIDYVFGATAAPGAAIEATAGRPGGARLLPFPTDLMAHLSERFGYATGLIPAPTYPNLQQADIPTTVMETIFLVSADVPDETVRRLTRTLIEARSAFASIHPSMATFDPDQSWRDTSVALHPGARKAYRELGFMD